MPLRKDNSESSELTYRAAGYACMFLALGTALLRNWYGAVGFGIAAITSLTLSRGRVYRPAVTRGPDGITCRYTPWRETTLYVVMIYGPAALLYAFGQPVRWLRLLSLVGLAMMAVGVAIYAREWRRCLLRISPAALTVTVPADRYALTEIPRDRIVSITGGTGARGGGATGPVTEITYLTTDSGLSATSTVLIGPTKTKNAMWVTIEQADLLAGLQAWKCGDPHDPTLLDRVDLLLRGADSGSERGSQG